MATGFERSTNDYLWDEIRRTAGEERRCVETMLRQLAEFDRRELYLQRGFSSLFSFCVEELRLSESDAGRRIRACRTAIKFPVLFEMIGSGALSVTGLAILSPALTPENWAHLSLRAANKSTREIERIVALIHGKPERPDRIRPLGRPRRGFPERHAAPEAEFHPATAGGLAPSPTPEDATRPPGSTPANPAPEIPKGENRVEIRFTADESFLTNLNRARELLFASGKGLRLETLLETALEDLLDKRDPRRKLARGRQRELRKMRRADTDAQPSESPAGSRAKRDRPVAPAKAPRERRTRTIPARVKAAVFERDEGRCSFTSEDGRRCGETKALEYDHVIPFAAGGESENPDNVRLLCKAHNLHEAKKRFGRAYIAERIAERKAAEPGDPGAERARPP